MRARSSLVRLLSALLLLGSLTVLALCSYAPPRVKAAETVGGSGPFMISHTTCSGTDDGTNGRLWVTLQAGGRSARWELVNANDRRPGNLDKYYFTWPSSIGPFAQLESIRFDMTGSDAWCATRFALHFNNQVIWEYRSTAPAISRLDTSPYAQSGNLWFSNDTNEAPSTFIRFTDLTVQASNATPTGIGNAAKLAFAYCGAHPYIPDPASYTTDPVTLVLVHDGLVDRVPFVTDSSFWYTATGLASIDYVRDLTEVRVEKVGNDSLCFRQMSVGDWGEFQVPSATRHYASTNANRLLSGTGTITFSGVTAIIGGATPATTRFNGLPLKKGANTSVANPYWYPTVAACAAGTNPVDNTCDNVDQDCDGTRDEHYSTTVACGVGACRRTATQTCANGVPASSCVPGVAVTEIASNGIDDDCDGKTDETRGDAFEACTSDYGCEVGLVCEPRGSNNANICVYTWCQNGVRDSSLEPNVDCGGYCPDCNPTQICPEACRAGEQTAPDSIAALRFSTGTFTRAGSATYEQEEGEIVAARANELRWVDRYGQRLGLFEGAGTNLFKQSEAWQTNPPWVPQAAPNLVITANQGPGANGAQTAELVAFTNGPGRSPMQTAVVPGTATTFSMYASAVPASTTGAVPRARVFALGASNAVLGTKTFYLEESPYRYDLPFATTGNSNASILLSHMAGFPTADTQVKTSSDYYVWGAQLEPQPFPTSYIPTTTATASRAADVLTFTSAQVGTSAFAWLRTGIFQIDVAPLYASTEMVNGAEYTLLSYGSGNDVAFVRTNGITRLRVRVGWATAQNRTLSWERGAAMTLTFDNAADKITVRGADTGDGEQAAPGLTFPAANLRIGGILGGTGEAYAAISEPRQVAGATKTCTVDPICKCGNGVVDPGETCDVALSAQCDTDCFGARDPEIGQTASDCPNGQVLGNNNGAQFGLASSADVCWPAFCLTNPGNSCGTVDSPCGKCKLQPNCAGKVCGSDPSDGAGGYCEGLCAGGQVGCTRDSDCASGFTCGIGMGPRFGKAAGTNICWSPLCDDYDPRRLQCGTTSSLCGTCPPLPNECGSRTCGTDRFGHACGTCGAGLSCNADGACMPAVTLRTPPSPEIVAALTPVPTAAVGSISGSFAVSDDGTATYSVALQVSPGRGGMQPALSLSYDSSRGDGFLTKGWSLNGLGGIARCAKTYAQDGEARGVRLDADDAFCLNGARLIPVPGDAGSKAKEYGPNAQEYRTELDSFVSVIGYDSSTVSRYTGPTYFEVWSKNGTVTTYGKTEQSRIWARIRDDVNRDPALKINASWLLDEVKDVHGNLMKVNYSRFLQGYKSGEFAHPDFSATDFDYTAELRPESISYGVDGSHTVTFEYQKQTTPLADDAQRFGWTPRAFTSGIGRYFSEPLYRVHTFVNGSEVHTYKFETDWIDQEWKLSSLTHCAWKNGVETCLPSTTFGYQEEIPVTPVEPSPTEDLMGGHITPSYEPDGGRWHDCSRDYFPHRLDLFTAIGVNIDGDPKQDLFNSVLGRPTETEEYLCDYFVPSWNIVRSSKGLVADGRAFGGGQPWSWLGSPPSDPVNAEGWAWLWSPAFSPFSVLDTNFDGKDELLSGSIFPDLNGDGRRDRVDCSPSLPEAGLGLRWSHRLGIDPATAQHASWPWSSETTDSLALDCNFVSSDFDGDGDDDIFVAHEEDDGMRLFAVSLVGGTLVSRDLGRPGWIEGQADLLKASDLRFMDANGDGLTDVLRWNEDDDVRVSLYLGTGRGFVRSPFDMSLTYWQQSDEDNYFNLSFVWDSDGDGRDELFMPSDRDGPDNDRWVQVDPLNPNVPTWSKRIYTAMPYRKVKYDHDDNDKDYTAYGWQAPTVLDWDGNGVDDVVFRGGEDRDPTAVIWRGGSRRSGLLTSVSDGSGRTIKVEYSDTPDSGDPDVEDHYTRGTYSAVGGCEYPQRCLAKLPHPIVVAHTVSGDLGPYANPAQPETDPKKIVGSRRYEYRYEDARIDVRGRGWLGFRKRIVREVEDTFPGVRVLAETTYESDLEAEYAPLKLFVGAGRNSKVTKKAFSTLSTGTQVIHETVETFDWRLKPAPTQVGSISRRPWIALDGQTTVSKENGSIVGKSVRSRTYDDYGNLLTDSLWWDDGRLDEVRTTYVSRDSKAEPNGVHWPALQKRWMVGLPETVETLGVADDRLTPFAWKTKSSKIVHTYNALGELVSSARMIGDDIEESSAYTYHQFGNIETVLRTGRDVFGQIAFTEYDANGMFPKSQSTGMHSVNGLLAVESGYDPTNGKLTWRKDSDGTWQTWSYDAFGRLGKTTRSDGTYTQYTIGSGTKLGAHSSLLVSGNTQPDQLTESNAFGQPIFEQKWDFGELSSVRERGFDSRGRLKAESNPHLATELPKGIHRYWYDDLDRKVAEQHPMVLADGSPSVSNSSVEYLSRATRTPEFATMFQWSSLPDASYAVVSTDAAGVMTATVLSMRGEIVAAIDPAKNKMFFTYEAFGHLSKRSFLGSETTFRTDALGHVEQIVDPSSGTHVYKRDGFGLLSEYRHNGAVTSYRFDGLGRLTDSDTPDGTYHWTWDKNGSDPDPTYAGKLVSEEVTSARIGNSKTAYEYHGPGGTLTAVRRTIDGETASLDTLVERDTYGRVSLVRMPMAGAAAPEAIGYHYYNGARGKGRVDRVNNGSTTDYWKLVRTDAYGADAEVTMIGGANRVTSRKLLLPETGQLGIAQTVNSAGQNIQYQGHQYDARGLLYRRIDTVNNIDETFVPDAFGRLNFHIVNGVQYAYDYDSHGNLTRKPGIGVLHYDDPQRPHRLTGTDDGRSFKYVGEEPGEDLVDNGNQVRREGGDIPGGRQEIAYAAFDLPITVKNGPHGAPIGTTSYRYDASNRRVVEEESSGTQVSSRTVYAGDMYRRVSSQGAQSQIVRVPTPSGVAVEISVDPAGVRTVRSVFTDLLGSTSGIADAQGTGTEKRYFEPFGGQSIAGTPSGIRAGFTGHEHDGSTGLINMRGRMYDAAIGRFVSPDPIVQSPFNSQSWNGYSYVMNSPMNATDPSGFVGEPISAGAAQTFSACEDGLCVSIEMQGPPATPSGGETALLPPLAAGTGGYEYGSAESILAGLEVSGPAAGGIADNLLAFSSGFAASAAVSFGLTSAISYGGAALGAAVAGTAAAPFVAAAGTVALVGLGAYGVYSAVANWDSISASMSRLASFQGTPGDWKGVGVGLGGFAGGAAGLRYAEQVLSALSWVRFAAPRAAPAASAGAGAAAEVTAAPSFTGGTDLLAKYAPAVAAESKGFFNVVLHANPEAAYIVRGDVLVAMDHRALAGYIRSLPGYSGQPVRLVACEAGACATGLAQNLANKLGVEVLASTTKVTVTHLGNFWAQGTGSFRSFLPGGGS